MNCRHKKKIIYFHQYQPLNGIQFDISEESASVKNTKSSKEFNEILEYMAVGIARDMYSTVENVHESENQLLGAIKSRKFN